MDGALFLFAGGVAFLGMIALFDWLARRKQRRSDQPPVV